MRVVKNCSVNMTRRSLSVLMAHRSSARPHGAWKRGWSVSKTRPLFLVKQCRLKTGYVLGPEIGLSRSRCGEGGVLQVGALVGTLPPVL